MRFISRRSAVLTGLSAAALISGCQLSKKLPPENSYEETFDTLLVSQDGKKLAIISQRFHYIFDVPRALAETLQASFRRDLEATFWNFTVAADNTIRGHLRLTLAQPTPAQSSEAQRLGFRAEVLALDLLGQRFAAAAPLKLAQTDKLNRRYTVRITEAPGAVTSASNGSRIANAILSPITQAIDGTVFFGAALVLLPLLLVSRREIGF